MDGGKRVSCADGEPASTRANAQTITLCVKSNGLVGGINLASCPSNTTADLATVRADGPCGAGSGPAGPLVTGAQGPVGPIGMTGPMGPTGAQGDQGEEGPANLIGGEGGPTDLRDLPVHKALLALWELLARRELLELTDFPPG